MIPKHDIEIKDFSVSLPQIISKISVIKDMFLFSNYPHGDYVFQGVGSILEEIADDLRAINRALY